MGAGVKGHDAISLRRDFERFWSRLLQRRRRQVWKEAAASLTRPENDGANRGRPIFTSAGHSLSVCVLMDASGTECSKSVPPTRRAGFTSSSDSRSRNRRVFRPCQLTSLHSGRRPRLHLHSSPLWTRAEPRLPHPWARSSAC